MNFNNEIKQALEVLKSGGTILYPTDTIPGIGCDATNNAAVGKIFQIKKRPEEKSLVVLVSDEAMLERYVPIIPEPAIRLLDSVEAPLTIIYPRSNYLASMAVADTGSVAIRVIREGFAHELIKRFRKPIVSTSANISGQPAPHSMAEVSAEIINSVDFAFLEQGQHSTGKASSIILVMEDNSFKIVRK